MQHLRMAWWIFLLDFCDGQLIVNLKLLKTIVS